MQKSRNKSNTVIEHFQSNLKIKAGCIIRIEVIIATTGDSCKLLAITREQTQVYYLKII